MQRQLHNLRHTPEYSAWHNMKKRCHSPKHPDYRSYGAKGITVCDRWLNSFVAFMEDMGPKPSQLHSLDRIDNSAGYDPRNCRWATKAEQSWNRNLPTSNTSGFKGVSYSNRDEVWRVTLKFNRVTYHLGQYMNLEDAVAARLSGECIYAE